MIHALSISTPVVKNQFVCVCVPQRGRESERNQEQCLDDGAVGCVREGMGVCTKKQNENSCCLSYFSY